MENHGPSSLIQLTALLGMKQPLQGLLPWPPGAPAPPTHWPCGSGLSCPCTSNSRFNLLPSRINHTANWKSQNQGLQAVSPTVYHFCIPHTQDSMARKALKSPGKEAGSAAETQETRERCDSHGGEWAIEQARESGADCGAA